MTAWMLWKLCGILDSLRGVRATNRNAKSESTSRPLAKDDPWKALSVVRVPAFGLSSISWPTVHNNLLG